MFTLTLVSLCRWHYAKQNTTIQTVYLDNCTSTNYPGKDVVNMNMQPNTDVF